MYTRIIQGKIFNERILMQNWPWIFFRTYAWLVFFLFLLMWSRLAAWGLSLPWWHHVPLHKTRKYFVEINKKLLRGNYARVHLVFREQLKCSICLMKKLPCRVDSFFYLTNFTVSLKANVRPNVFQEPRKDVTLTNLSLYTHISWSECKPVLRATFRVGEKSYGGITLT
jgi:hypothetical protein